MSTTTCPKCAGTNGAHGLIHTRYPQGGGGSNTPCPRGAELAELEAILAASPDA